MIKRVLYFVFALGSTFSLRSDEIVEEEAFSVNPKRVNVILYAQSDVIIPGVGLTLQLENIHSTLGCELDVGVSSIILTTIARASISALFFSKDHKHSFNIGGGAGYCLDMFSATAINVAIIPMGYSYRTDNNVYWRVGINTFIDKSKTFRKYEVSPLPFLRVGYVF